MAADYRHDNIGFNYRLSNVNAAVGLGQIERLSTFLERKQNIALYYDQFFDSVAWFGVTKMPSPDWGLGNNWLYSVTMPTERIAHEFVDYMRQNQIETRIFWRSLSSLQPFSNFRSVLHGVSVNISGRVVSLPSSTSIANDQLFRVLDCMFKFCQSK